VQRGIANAEAGSKTSEQLYQEYVDQEKRKELEQLCEVLRKDVEGKFRTLERDLGYQVEVQRFLVSVSES